MRLFLACSLIVGCVRGRLTVEHQQIRPPLLKCANGKVGKLVWKGEKLEKQALVKRQQVRKNEGRLNDMEKAIKSIRKKRKALEKTARVVQAKKRLLEETISSLKKEESTVERLGNTARAFEKKHIEAILTASRAGNAAMMGAVRLCKKQTKVCAHKDAGKTSLKAHHPGLDVKVSTAKSTQKNNVNSARKQGKQEQLAPKASVQAFLLAGKHARNAEREEPQARKVDRKVTVATSKSMKKKLCKLAAQVAAVTQGLEEKTRADAKHADQILEGVKHCSNKAQKKIPRIEKKALRP
eukprot:TRINITY_DN17215_c0_g1_i1.p1 TRINITY_DN17215_c0_g1~~TRINITY_DN17215_c0_g1_i1.p1  ORF type:complete len:296 (+),score=72.75 TRINITY_DN17215_c0_g1_i1:117-1004(+)